MKKLIAFLLLLLNLEKETQAADKFDEEIFRNIPPYSIIEGSTRFGGIQPDYFFDIDSPEFDHLKKFADELREAKTPVLEKIPQLISMIRSIFQFHNESSDPVYLNLMSKYRKIGNTIPLSQYINCGAGVCRENAMLLHFFMQRAGISNSFVYVKYSIDYESEPRFTEDHGFTVFEYEDELWIADSYYKQFNGYSFDEFVKSLGTLIVPKRGLPFSEVRTEKRGLIVLNRYPKVFRRIITTCKEFLGSR